MSRLITKEVLHGEVWKSVNTYEWVRTTYRLMGIKIWSKLEWK